MISEDKKSALRTAARNLEIPYEWLYNLIRFESNFDYAARNPRSGARGLIQITNTVANEMGFLNADDMVRKYPSFYTQLFGPVLSYFKLPGKNSPYPSKQSFYLAVFYPGYRNVPTSNSFPESIKELNPGIKTVQDYINKVDQILSIPEPEKIFQFVSIAAVIGTTVYFLYKTTSGRK